MSVQDLHQVLMCGCVSGSHFRLNLVFLPSFVPLFDVQIVGCQPGLTVVSKLEVSNLISGSINQILSWDFTKDYRLFN